MRVSESFANGTLELIEEVDASMLVLSWSGPKLANDYVFGNEIDEVGEQSAVPSVAVHLVRPWNRVVLVVGDTRVPWHREDAQLAVSLASRLRGRKHLPLIVFGTDHSMAEEAIGTAEDVTYVTVKRGSRALFEAIRPDDLVVAPAYVLQALPAPSQVRLIRRLAQIDIAIIAGPHRLTVAGRSNAHRSERILGPQQ